MVNITQCCTCLRQSLTPLSCEFRSNKLTRACCCCIPACRSASAAAVCSLRFKPFQARTRQFRSWSMVSAGQACLVASITQTAQRKLSQTSRSHRSALPDRCGVQCCGGHSVTHTFHKQCGLVLEAFLSNTGQLHRFHSDSGSQLDLSPEFALHRFIVLAHLVRSLAGSRGVFVELSGNQTPERQSVSVLRYRFFRKAVSAVSLNVEGPFGRSPTARSVLHGDAICTN